MAPGFLDGTTRAGFGCMAIASIGALLYGFDNGWWGTILGTHAFLRDHGSCEMIDGKETCHLSAPQVSAGSAVQSVGIKMKGFSLEQLDYLFNNGVPTLKFKKYKFADPVLAVQDKGLDDNVEGLDNKVPETTVEHKA